MNSWDNAEEMTRKNYKRIYVGFFTRSNKAKEILQMEKAQHSTSTQNWIGRFYRFSAQKVGGCLIFLCCSETVDFSFSSIY